MTITSVWIGELAAGPDPLDWGGDWGRSNTPKRALSPRFPPAARPGSYQPWSTVVARIREGIYHGKQVDWGAWAAIVTKPDIVALVDEMYGSAPATKHDGHIAAFLVEIQATLDMLQDDGRFALVATEL
jgi:hypothetical protein